jgi:hypothetical protein
MVSHCNLEHKELSCWEWSTPDTGQVYGSDSLWSTVCKCMFRLSLVDMRAW